MKQTISILSALIIALLVLSGFILSTNLQQSQLLAQGADALEKLRGEKEALMLRTQTLETENHSLNISLQKTTEERDAVSQKWNDAVLASQEANDALAQQTDHARTLEAEVERLEQHSAELQEKINILRAAPTPRPAFASPFSSPAPYRTPSVP